MSIIHSKLLIQFFFQEKLGIEILKENVQSNVEYVNSIPEEKVRDFFSIYNSAIYIAIATETFFLFIFSIMLVFIYFFR